MSQVLIGLGVVAGLVVLIILFSIAWNWKYIQRHRKLEREGTEFIGWCVSVDPILFRKPKKNDDDVDDSSGPVGLIFATDPVVGYDSEVMHALIARCLGLMKRTPEAKEKRLAKELKNDKFRDEVWVPLPKAWTDGAEVIYTMAEVFRSNLHKERLKWRFVRVKAILDEPELGVTHMPYHEDDDEDAPYHPAKKRRARVDDEDDE